MTIRVAGTVPRAGTRIAANYGWTDFRVLMPVHLFVTQTGSQDIGVNVHFSQPLPLIRVPWRLEATADLRNLLGRGRTEGGVRRRSWDRHVPTTSETAMAAAMAVIRGVASTGGDP